MPPPALFCEDQRAANRLMKCPGNVFGLEAACCWQITGFPAFGSALVAAAAALARFAACAVEVWQPAWSTLCAAAEELGPLRRVVEGAPWAEHWRSPAFAATLRQMHRGELGAAVPRRWRAAFAAAGAAAQDGAFPQKAAAKAFEKRAFRVDTLWARLEAGARRIAPGIAGDVLGAPPAPGKALKMAPHTAACAIRTFLNGWSTSRRMCAEVRARCVLGCAAEDSLRHYASCGRMAALAARVLGAAPRDTADDPWHIRDGWRGAAAAHTIYHLVLQVGGLPAGQDAAVRAARSLHPPPPAPRSAAAPRSARARAKPRAHRLVPIPEDVPLA